VCCKGRWSQTPLVKRRTKRLFFIRFGAHKIAHHANNVSDLGGPVCRHRRKRVDSTTFAAMTVKTVLIVEDDKPLQGLLQEACVAAGFHVIAAGDGESAVQALQRRLPDVVLCDLLLPGISGFDVLQQLRNMPGGNAVPAFVMSGVYRGQKHRHHALEQLGCRAWFAKPVRVAELVTALMQATGQPSAQQTVNKTPTPGRDPLADSQAQRERRTVEAVVSPKPHAAPTVQLRGHLQQLPFGTLLAQLRYERRTGALLLRRERVKKIIDIIDGVPVFVKSNLLSECLGRVLVTEGLLSLVDCERSIELQAVMRKPQGQLLVEMGVLSNHQLATGLRLQLKHKLFDVFGWEVGDFELLSPAPLPDQMIALDMSITTLIYEGLRRGVDDARLQILIEPLLSRCLVPSPQPWFPPSELALDASERQALSQLDGQTTIANFVDHGPLPRQQAMQLVCAITQAHLYDVVDVARDTIEMNPLPNKRPPPRPVSGRTVSIDEARTRLHSSVRRMRNADPFAVLGVSRRSSTTELMRAHGAQHRALDEKALAAQLAVPAPGDVRALATQVQGYLDAALDAVADEARREQWLRRQQPRHSTDDAVRTLLRVEVLSKRGCAAVADARFDEAVRAFAEATALQPTDGELVSWLGFALWSQQPDDPLVEAEALTRLEQGVSLSPHAARSWLHLGRVHARARRDREASRAYQRALALHPENREAADYVGRQPNKPLRRSP
jgi:CheY-like chemotaxis protein/Flp pilus assembly protein TadD